MRTSAHAGLFRRPRNDDRIGSLRVARLDAWFHPMDLDLPTPQSVTLAAVIGALRADARIEAILGAGSLLDGAFDAHSDLDLVVVVGTAAHADVMAARRPIAERAGSLLAAFTGEHVGEPRLLICLYGPPLVHVDLKFVTVDALDAMVERPRLLWAREPAAIAERLDAARIAWPDRDPQWFEDRAWIWLHYGATKAARGELFEAIGLLAFFREQILGPMLHRNAGRRQRGVRRIESPATLAALTETLAGHDRSAVKAALAASAALYLQLRADEPPPRPVSRMPDALSRFWAQDQTAPEDESTLKVGDDCRNENHCG